MKTRFAPSPTGFLHVGGLRTALFAYLFAKRDGGIFLLRVEDTDRERFVEGGLENILNSLYWAGIIPDEGVLFDSDHQIIQKGEHGPYIQSERKDKGIYKEHIDMIISEQKAYPCFCTKQRLDELRSMREKNGIATGYDGKCRELSQAEANERIEKGEEFVVRMKMPKEGVTKFDDLVRGEVEFENKLVDDQVLIKSDGFPTYHFAVVVDDHLMGITHIIRGEEWISSTPKHINIYKMFGWDVPQFAHLPLLVNEQKQKLSKRHGDVSVTDFRQHGYLSEALINFVAFLGWNPGDDREIFSLEDLVKEFSIEKVSKSASVFNREKLEWFNKQYLKSIDIYDLGDRARRYFTNLGIDVKNEDFYHKALQMERERVGTLAEFPEALGFLFAGKLEYDPNLLIWKKSTKEEALNKLKLTLNYLNTINVQDWTSDKLEERVVGWIKENEFGVGDVLWPTRVALSGQKNSPGPFEIASALGKEKTLERINNAIELLS